MSKRRWSPDLIASEISRLHSAGIDITQGRMEAIDSRLTSAAIRYFGSWRAAVQAAGIDYEQVAAIGKARRAEKVTKWTQERILAEIRRLHQEGEDLSPAVIRRKYLSLYATARRKEHFGSWAEAVTAAGVDYASVKQVAQRNRRERAGWKRRLLEEWQANASDADSGHAGRQETSERTSSSWLQGLLQEKLAEVYENPGQDAEQVHHAIKALMESVTRASGAS